jgi:hypothetical protein
MTNPPSVYLHDAAAPDDWYTGMPPWDIDRPKPALPALASVGAISGRVLDAGCGTGEHVLMAAGSGSIRLPRSRWTPPPTRTACPSGWSPSPGSEAKRC